MAGEISHTHVEADDVRPARPDGTCFYCRQQLGEPHKPECILPQRRVRLRMTVEYDVNVPADFDQAMIEFARNQGSWCASNALDELTERFGDNSPDGSCMCGSAHFEVVGGLGEVPDTAKVTNDFVVANIDMAEFEAEVADTPADGPPGGGVFVLPASLVRHMEAKTPGWLDALLVDLVEALPRGSLLPEVRIDEEA